MIKTLIKKHWTILILAISFGIIIVLPFFYFESKLGSNFHGIFSEIVNDELFYYARIKDVVDGHSFLGNAYLAEHKDELPQGVFLAEYLLAQPVKLFNIGINTVHLIYNFLLPAIAFFLTYLGLYLITRSRFWSIIFSSFLFFGLYLMVFIRPVSPQFNFIFWLTQFIFLWLFLEKRSKKFLFLSALNFGLLFYIYPYYWTFYLILFSLLFAAYFFRERSLAYAILKITAGGLVLATPYFYLNYLSSKLPYYTETLTRLGMIYTRFPSGIRIIFWSVLVLAAFSWFLRIKVINWNTKTQFFIFGILASIIAVNQHLITGRNLEFSSHYSMGAMFFLVFAAAYLWQKLRERQNNLKLLSAVLLIIVLVVVANGLYKYSNQAFAISEERIYIQNYAPIFDWLNKNTEKDSVIFTDEELSRLIPVYTHNNVYYIREANLFFISDDEVLDRFILNNFFENFDQKFIIENDRSIFGVRYVDAYGHAVQGNKLGRLLGLETRPEVYLPNEAIKNVEDRAGELKKSDFVKEIKKYKIDYLMWDENKDANWQVAKMPFKSVFEANNIIIYRVD